MPESCATVESWPQGIAAAAAADYQDTCWLSRASSAVRETEAITSALQASLSGGDSGDAISSSILLFDPVKRDPDSPAFCHGAERARSPGSQRAGRVRKRRSRAKRSVETTFITTDAANFRQMVQQVTGVRIGPVLKPEPQRPWEVLQQQQRCSPPTLGTSTAFLPEQDETAGLMWASFGSFEPAVEAGLGIDLESWPVM